MNRATAKGIAAIATLARWAGLRVIPTAEGIEIVSPEVARDAGEPLASPDRMAKNDPNTCDHDGGKAWAHLPVPNEHQCRCALCDSLGYTRSRSRGPRRKNAKPPKVIAYSCRVKGCRNAVIERRYTTGFELANGCSEHPVRASK